MPRMTTGLCSHLHNKNVQSNVQNKAQQKTVQLNKRFALLSFFDACFYSVAFCLLLISPVNAEGIKDSDSISGSISNSITTVELANDSNNINIYAAHVTESLEASCQSTPTRPCKLNVVSRAELLSALLANDTEGHISKLLKNSDYEVLIGSAAEYELEKSEFAQQLVFEVSALWRGITIHNAQLSVEIDNQGATEKELIAVASNKLLGEWIENAVSKEIFAAEYLYDFLGASDYAKELKVPNLIGEFALSRQHLFSDPMEGMLTRYVHKDFELAVFDVYVYPLKNNDSIEVQSKNELLSEQQDIRLLSKALGEDALTMTDIYELKAIEGAEGIRVFAFEASLETPSDPLFATQYIYVKHDKIVKFSINAPARITDGLLAQAINAIQVPVESALMKQVRHIEQTPKDARPTAVAP